MDGDRPEGWKRFKRLKVNRKVLSRRMKKAETVTVRHARRFIFKRLGSIREVRRHIAIWLVLVGYIIAASALQLVWFQQGYRITAPAPGGTYAEADLGPINTLNPLFASTSAEQAASELMFSRLLNDDSSGHLNYDLATNMTLDSTQKVYTLTIRPNVQWSDGEPLTAQDVAFTVGLLKNSAVRSTITGWSDIDVKALNDTTVTFTLPAVYASFPAALNFPILPEHILKDVNPANLRESSFSNNPVGSGPFTFRLLQNISQPFQYQVVHMISNNSYYGGAPRINRIQIDAFQSQKDILQALQTSEVSAAVDLSSQKAKQVNTARYNVQRSPLNAGVYALLNTTSDTLKDKSIRQALQAGTDTTALRHAIGPDIPQLYLPFVKGQITGSDVPSAPTYDPHLADSLLTKDGWVLKNGVRTKDGHQLTLNVVTIKDDDLQTALSVLQSQWKALGIVVTSNVVDPSDPSANIVQNILEPRAYDVLLYQLMIGVDPDVYAYWHSSQATALGFNFSNYNNALSDDALATARNRVDPALRNAKYITFAKQWLSDVPAIGLYQSTLQYVSNKQINTLQPSDKLVLEVDRFNNVNEWTVTQQQVYQTP